MKKTLLINNKQIPFLASASTTYRYKQTFGTDLLTDLKNINPKATSEAELKPVIQLAFIMAKQANPNMNDDFLSWLDKFEVLDILCASREILEIWKRSAQVSSKLKKKNGR